MDQPGCAAKSQSRYSETISQSVEQFARNFRDTHSYRRRFFCRRISRKAGIDFLLRRLELIAHVVLFADEDQLSRRGVVVVLQEVMHAEPEIVQIELAEVFAVNRKRIEVVLLELATVLASFLVFPPEKTGGEQDERGDDRRDDINRNVAAESFDHMFRR